MSITKIHLFPKNTDAVASLKGYEYQKLKTLQAWLQNGVDKNDELIYCEYEEDIFHRNEKSQTSKFRQLKLYSNNFSFSSDEIKKAIVHFFSLYTKKNYLFENVLFVFETNSSIAREYKDNETKLLQTWYENQKNLSSDQLKEFSAIIKNIVTESYSLEYEALEKKGNTSKEEQEAYALFKSLKDDVWIDFIKCIKWEFDGIESDEAIEIANEKIQLLILSLPYYIDKNNAASFFGILYQEVSKKTIEGKPEDRALDINFLYKLCLEQGSSEDKWYVNIFEEWKSFKELKYFSLGEFYRVLDAAQHCRRNKYLWDHCDTWIKILESFYAFPTIPPAYKRKTVYELVWLNLKADTDTFETHGTLINFEDKLKFFFNDINSLKSENELEETLNVLNILVATSKLKLSSLTEKEVFNLVNQFDEKLNEEFKLTTNSNRKSAILEYKSFISFGFRKDFENKPFKEVIQPLYDIIPLLDSSPTYNATQLSRRINSLITLFIQFDFKKYEEVITSLEDYALSLEPFVIKRDGKYKAGKINFERGVRFINSKQKGGLLKGLDYFHKANALFLTSETMAGYVLTSLNISQLYSALGLNYAAKYYALTALWLSINDEKSKLLHRVPQCFSILQHIDFKQGSWMNALSNFSDYVRTKTEFDYENFDIEKDPMVLKTFSEIALVIYSAAKVQPELLKFFEELKVNFGILWSESLKGIVEMTEKSIKTPEQLNALISQKIDDRPLNDLGKVRTISWLALGSKWEIIFQNSPSANAVAEEFCSILQILIAEIVLTGSDFHLIKGTIKINIEIGTEFKAPEQKGNNKAHEYNLVLKELDTKDLNEINLHNAKIGASLLVLFGELSLLKDAELNSLYTSLFKERNLATRSYTVNTYQRIYRAFYDSKLFELDKRQDYSITTFIGSFPREYGFLKWESSLSKKYSQSEAISMIVNRNKKAQALIAIAIDKVKGNAEFKIIVSDLRKKGWLDWQITLAMFNFILDQKAKKILDEKNITIEEIWLKEFNKTFNDLLNKPEDSFHMLFPPEAFKTESFQLQFDQLPLYVLRSWGLEYRAKSPNFYAIKEFLNIRFRFNQDDTFEGNLLKGV